MTSGNTNAIRRGLFTPNRCCRSIESEDLKPLWDHLYSRKKQKHKSFLVRYEILYTCFIPKKKHTYTQSVFSAWKNRHTYIEGFINIRTRFFYKDEQTTNQQHKQVKKQQRLWGLSWGQQRQLHIEMKTKAGVISYKWMGLCLRSQSARVVVNSISLKLRGECNQGQETES